MCEFRVFVPLLNENLINRLNMLPSEIDQYQQYQYIVISTFGNSTSFDENRIDRYVVGGNHFGLKYRNERKLEIKIRKNYPTLVDGWIEKWFKKSIKKSIDKPEGVDEVLNLLADNGFEIVQGMDREALMKADCVIVNKHRRNIFLDTVSAEVCYIDSSQGASGDNQQWYSFCMEGERSFLLSILSPTGPFSSAQREYMITILPALQAFLNMASITKQCIARTAMEISESEGVARDDTIPAIDTSGNTLQFHVFPICGGYPTWVRTIGIGSSSVDASIALDNFSDIIRRIINKFSDT